MCFFFVLIYNKLLILYFSALIEWVKLEYYQLKQICYRNPARLLLETDGAFHLQTLVRALVFVFVFI